MIVGALHDSLATRYNREKAQSQRPITRKEILVSIAAYEQRLQALEAAIADIRSQQSARDADRSIRPTDELTPDVDHLLVPAVPPKQLARFPAKLCRVETGPRDLALSQAEWTALNIDE
jgi:hypothetical protein